VAVALVLVAGLAVGGAPVWSHTSHTGTLTVTSRPEWKLDLTSLSDVRALDERGMLDGEVLLPPLRMKVLTMFTTDAFAVVPRDWFVQNIHEPAADRRARRLLYRLVAARPPFPPPSQVRAALDRLDVTLACAGPSAYRGDIVRRLEAAGRSHPTAVGSLTCLTSSG
jgi:hypothetical protein